MGSSLLRHHSLFLSDVCSSPGHVSAGIILTPGHSGLSCPLALHPISDLPHTIQCLDIQTEPALCPDLDCHASPAHLTVPQESPHSSHLLLLPAMHTHTHNLLSSPLFMPKESLALSFYLQRYVFQLTMFSIPTAPPCFNSKHP